MTGIPDPSFNEKGAAATQLEAGLTAIKQGNYSAAIAYLENVCQTQPTRAGAEPTPTLVRAQMGLVTAYSKSGQIQTAITLCQTLNQSTNSQVKGWAERQLADFAKRYPHLQTTPDPSSHTPHPVAETSNTTGFVPLDHTSPPSTNPTGFVPLNQTADSAAVPPVKSAGMGKKSRSYVNRSNTSPAKGASLTPEPGSNPSTISTPSSVDPGDEDLFDLSADATPLDNSQFTQPSTPNPPFGKDFVQQPSTFNPQPSLPREWQQAGRAQGWKPLQAVQQERLWVVQAGTAFALFWVIRFLVEFVMDTTNNTLVNIPFLQPIEAFYEDPATIILIGLGILFCASPWLIDAFLKGFYGCQPLSLATLARSSPEAARMLPRVCQQRRLKVPALRLLPTSAPMSLTYGNLPFTSRIVVSQGLLDQLADDEIATIYAGELGHVTRHRRVGLVIAAVLGLIGGFFTVFQNEDLAGNCWWLAFLCLPMGLDLAVISLVVLVAQLPYTVYRFGSQWADSTDNSVIRTIAAVISALSYSLFQLIRYLGLWVSRMRIYFSDRFAVDVTGNPNGLTRALLKINLGIAQDIQRHGLTSWLLESFDLLMPVGYNSAISLGSLPSQVPFEEVLQWDRLNLGRQWLVINNSHPLIGERLSLLSLYARHWKLNTELDFDRYKPSTSSKIQNPLFLQAAPFLGMLVGVGLTVILWVLAWIGSWIRFRQLEWVLDDYAVLAVGCALIGFSIGTILRINAFFPDIKPTNVQTDPNLPELYTNPDVLPIKSQPVSFSGKLLGRRGVSNWLGQDLILQTHTGLIKLHHFSQLGSLGNLLFQSTRTHECINRQVTVTGWFRRGANAWIDIETLRTQGGLASRGGHPIWSTILACAAAGWGAYIIFRGEF